MSTRQRVISLALIALFSFCLTQATRADELSELKAKMEDMQKRISGLETEKETRVKTQKEAEQKGAVLENKVAPKDSFQAYWKDGLRLTTEDKKFDLRIYGKMHLDSAWMSEQTPVKDKLGDMKDNAEFRRVLIQMAGTIYGNCIYKVELNFADGHTKFDDVYMGLKDMPYVYEFKIGHFKEFFSLEELQSDNYTTFMERGLPRCFVPGRNTGIGVNSYLLDKRLTWAVGAFRDANDYGAVAASNEWNGTARVTGLPLYKDNGKHLLHFGAAYSFRKPNDPRYQSRPESHLAPYFVDTKAFAVNHAQLLGLESAYVYGPFSLQGEFMNVFASRPGSSKDVNFSGLYAQASYILTGEHKNYDMANGRFANIVPFKNFSINEMTLGAWEIAARYSYLDLKDSDINGGMMSDATVGLNWYLNPNMRIMGNYVHANRNGIGYADILETRFQVNF